MNIEKLIRDCNFSEYERDSGTGGFCAMFALALFRATIHENPKLILACAENDGELLRNKKGELYWRHAAILVNGAYYDIDGRQEPEWIIENYLWGISAKDYEGTLVELSANEFITEIKKTPSAMDWRFYALCKRKIGRAIQHQD